MQIPHLINLIHGEMTAWRQDLHAHPELGFEEHRTSEFVAGKLAAARLRARERPQNRELSHTGDKPIFVWYPVRQQKAHFTAPRDGIG
jgi:metal-dependent amidase/aminoacylase/carboxypeptidase family protein